MRVLPEEVLRRQNLMVKLIDLQCTYMVVVSLFGLFCQQDCCLRVELRLFYGSVMQCAFEPEQHDITSSGLSNSPRMVWLLNNYSLHGKKLHDFTGSYLSHSCQLNLYSNSNFGAFSYYSSRVIWNYLALIIPHFEAT